MKLSTTLTLGVAVAVTALSLATPAFATQNSNHGNDDHKVTICHATNSATNPYVKITVDTHAAVTAGHSGHGNGVVALSLTKAAELKEAKITWGDVIPSIPDQNFAGVNWNGEGKALHDRNCAAPEVPATPVKTEKPHTPEKKTQTTPAPQPSPKASAPAELPQTGAPSPLAAVLGLSSLVAAGSHYVMSRRVR